jgi:hypothetical protein
MVSSVQEFQQAAEKLAADAESNPQALKRG